MDGVTHPGICRLVAASVGTAGQRDWLSSDYILASQPARWSDISTDDQRRPASRRRHHSTTSAHVGQLAFTRHSFTHGRSVGSALSWLSVRRSAALLVAETTEADVTRSRTNDVIHAGNLLGWMRRPSCCCCCSWGQCEAHARTCRLVDFARVAVRSEISWNLTTIEFVADVAVMGPMHNEQRMKILIN